MLSNSLLFLSIGEFDKCFKVCPRVFNDLVDLLLLGSEVDKLSKIFIKTSNAAENIESDIQNTELPRTDDLII